MMDIRQKALLQQVYLVVNQTLLGICLEAQLMMASVVGFVTKRELPEFVSKLVPFHLPALSLVLDDIIELVHTDNLTLLQKSLLLNV